MVVAGRLRDQLFRCVRDRDALSECGEGVYIGLAGIAYALEHACQMNEGEGQPLFSQEERYATRCQENLSVEIENLYYNVALLNNIPMTS